MGVIWCPHCERDIEIELAICPDCCDELVLIDEDWGTEEYRCPSCRAKVIIKAGAET